MTALISANTIAAPLGYLLAGQILEHWGVVPLFTLVVAGITSLAVLFAAFAWRQGDVEPLAEPATT
jgi:MFS family permease